jgi:hypothetical protein
VRPEGWRGGFAVEARSWLPPARRILRLPPRSDRRCPNGIELHAVLDIQFGTGNGASVSVTNPGDQSGTVDQATSLPIQASASDGGTLRYTPAQLLGNPGFETGTAARGRPHRRDQQQRR